jgi:hypothetical protein
MDGWIKIHRKINRHWVWENSDYFKWWIDILLEANFESKKTSIKGCLLICERGDVLYSYDTWAKRWNTNKSKVMRFLKLLEKDSMITLKSETVTTRITVCNYDSYQNFLSVDETQMKRKRNASETQTKPTKERKEIKKEKILLSYIVCEEIFKKNLTFLDHLQDVYKLNAEQAIPYFKKFNMINEGVEFENEQKIKSSFIYFLENNLSKGEEIKKRGVPATKRVVKNDREPINWAVL